MKIVVEVVEGKDGELSEGEPFMNSNGGKRLRV